MEILDEQPIEKPPYDNKSLFYGISAFCGLVNLGYLLVKKPGDAYAWGKLTGTLLFFWLLAFIYYFIWKALKLNVKIGVLLFAVLVVLVLMAQISQPAP